MEKVRGLVLERGGNSGIHRNDQARRARKLIRCERDYYGSDICRHDLALQYRALRIERRRGPDRCVAVSVVVKSPDPDCVQM